MNLFSARKPKLCHENYLIFVTEYLHSNRSSVTVRGVCNLVWMLYEHSFVCFTLVVVSLVVVVVVSK